MWAGRFVPFLLNPLFTEPLYYLVRFMALIFLYDPCSVKMCLLMNAIIKLDKIFSKHTEIFSFFQETVCIKCQIMFSGKSKKNIN